MFKISVVMNTVLKKIPFFCLLCTFCFGAFLFDLKNTVRYAILVSSIASAFLTLNRNNFSNTIKDYWCFILPWLPWFLGISVVIVIHGGRNAYFDTFLLLTAIFFGLKNIKIDRKWVLTAICLTCLSLSVAVVYTVTENGLSRDIYDINRNILMPCFTLLLVCCLAALLFESDRYSVFFKLFMLLTCFVGLSVIVLTEVRTTLLALFALIPVVLFYQKRHRFKCLLVLFIICLTMLFLFWLTGRLQQGVSNLIAYQAGDSGSSLGIRLELWKLSFQAFLTKPLVGWGFWPFDQILASGFSFPVEWYEPSHSHNDFFFILVCSGLLGTIAWILSIYLLIKNSLRDPIRMALLFACLAMGLTERLWFENHKFFLLMPTIWILLYLSQPTYSVQKNGKDPSLREIP
ncbi:O-antigen ligase family protein [Parasutterella secunda]|uniref:O-antigen ligase family protein n=1 Tax=Parasutterella secunda TaxID=626947 RepID=UPI0025A386EE|nr:O-antigen ligase family protein [Parasutterella secunda]MDM8225822.1 O-antigen ligase family protein [Parasutterella secunda]